MLAHEFAVGVEDLDAVVLAVAHIEQAIIGERDAMDRTAVLLQSRGGRVVGSLRAVVRLVAISAPPAFDLPGVRVDHDETPVLIAVGHEALIGLGIDKELRGPAEVLGVVAAAASVRLADLHQEFSVLGELHDHAVVIVRRAAGATTAGWSGLIFRRGSPPEATYTFKHALVQDTAHDSLLKSRRQQLHARIAEAIERLYPETASNQPQLLAQHYAEAGFAERSAKAWLQAGRLASSRSASQEAAIQFARGIEVLQRMKASATRDALELDLQIGRGSVCAVAYGHPATETESAWVRAIELLRSYPEDPRNFWARRGLSSVYGARANMTAYAVLADETLELAQKSVEADGALRSAHDVRQLEPIHG